MLHRSWFPSLIALSLLPWLAPQPVATGKTVTVKMTDVSATQFQFEPAQVSVSPGDTVRFVQAAPTPHNVDFRSAPATASLGAAKTGPFLVAAGQTYDLVIDSRFPAGSYQFVCTPHEMLGMKGVITVLGN